MAGKGFPPKNPEQRRGRQAVDEFIPAKGTGWQHGQIPRPPTKLTKAARDAWRIWFTSWFAHFWGPQDLPGLRVCIQLYDAVAKGELDRAMQLRQMLDTYGITPKGQQERRWSPPKVEDPAETASEPGQVVTGRWGNLSVAEEAG